MIFAANLCVAALVIGVAAPRYLRPLLSPKLNPSLALSAWTISLILFVLTLAAAPIALITRPGQYIPRLNSLVLTCAESLHNDELPWTSFAELTLVSATIALALRIGFVGSVLVSRHRQQTAQHLAMLKMLCNRQSSEEVPQTIWLESPHPAAYSITAGRGVVVATEGLSALTPQQQRAVLAHERAHLRGKHHQLVLFAEILGAALPFVPLCRQAPAWFRVLTELTADHCAAREFGPDAVRSALVRAAEWDRGSRNDPPSKAFRPSTALSDRIHWLDTMPDRGHVSSAASYPVGAMLSALPGLLVIGAGFSSFALYCLTRLQ